jgi:hypothetical protein
VIPTCIVLYKLIGKRFGQNSFKLRQSLLIGLGALCPTIRLI